MEQHLIVANLLDQLQQTLQELDLWQESKPSPEALASQQPFACDCMSLSQWLQFIFIPKMRQLVEQEVPLPPMAITPYAEQVFIQQQQAGLLKLLQALDAAVQ